MRFKHLIAACEPNFCVQAFQQYAEDKKAILKQVIDLANIAAISDNEQELQEALIDSGLDLTSLSIWIDDCPVSADQLIRYVKEQADRAINGYVEDGVTVFGNTDFSLSGLNPNITSTLSTGMMTLKEQLLNLTALGSSCKAFISEAGNSIADKLTILRNDMTDYFNEGAIDSSPFYKEVKSILGRCVNPKQFMTSIMSLIDVEKGSEVDSEDSLDKFFEAQRNKGFKGVSPYFALGIKFPALAPIVTAVKSIGTTIRTFFTGITIGLIKGASKAYYTSVSPLDIYSVNDKGDNLFNETYWSGERDMLIDVDEIHMTQNGFENLKTYVANNQNHWHQVDTYVANLYFCFTDMYPYGQDDPGKFYLKYKFLFQPKTIWKGHEADLGFDCSYGAIGEDFDISNEITASRISSTILDQPTTIQSEQLFLRRVWDNILTFNQISALTLMDSGYVDGVELPYVEDFIHVNTSPSDTSAYTNADVYATASGWGINGRATQIGPDNIPEACYPQQGVDMLIKAFIVSQFTQQFAINEDNFFPYVKDNVSINPGKWAIKTDEQNQQAATHFYTNAIVITIAVIAAIWLGYRVSAKLRDVKFKKMAYLLNTNAKLASGQVLTAEEQLRYSRFSRRFSFSPFFESGLVSDTVTFKGDSPEVLNLVSLLITGTR